ncbi:MAG: PQQ-binding-like beta-propeller repeat protein [Thaumarchaeota archaeon]|nr:PQQ-binding-like beta-propeller repeat protein [Nitrososphaerota archaeon]
MSWLFPLPTHPTALLSVSGGLGVDTAPLIINGTIYAVTQFDQVFALNAANGNVLWTLVLPVTSNSSLPGTTAVSLHLHDGNEQFTTKLFNHTPTLWISANNFHVYAINALTGQYEMNFSDFSSAAAIAGNCPVCVYHVTGATNVLVDENTGVAITSMISTNISDSGRCFFFGWNITVNPVKLLWTTYCTPPQSGSTTGPDPNWTVNEVNAMKSAQIFYPGPAYNAGGSIPGNSVVDLKSLTPSQLNATLYDDWGQVNQSPACKAFTGGMSTGSTDAGWGAPWLLGSGPTKGLAFVNTNNKDPYGGSSCSPGPNLWSASILGLNETNGNLVWGFQANAHDVWDYDCSWWQAMGNETVNGVNTQVIFKTCKAGYLFEINAATGKLIWAWTPPTSIELRCQYCYMLNPLNRTQMTQAWLNPTGTAPTICTPCTFSFESQGAFDPVTNDIYVVSQNYPQLWYYVPFNLTNYHTSGGTAPFPLPGHSSTTDTGDNSTVEAVNAATGQMVWTHFIPTQGYRGGVTVSGNLIYLTLSSGDILMLNAQNGNLVKDFYIGGPLNVHASIGATTSGQMEIIVPITAGLVTWGTGVPGDIVALTLQNVPASGGGSTVTSTSTITSGGSTVTSTVTSGGQTVTSTTTVGAGPPVTVTSTASGGGSSTTLYGVAAVAVVFIIATGYLAMRVRRPAS